MPAHLPPTTETACSGCGVPVPGTRAGYAALCPTCQGAADADPDLAAADAERARRERYPYGSPRGAMASAVRVSDRCRGVPALLPQKDRIEGGPGSSRSETLAQAAAIGGIVFRVVLKAHGDDSPAGEEAAAVRCRVVAAWAVGAIGAHGGTDEHPGVPGPFTWAWAAELLGAHSERAAQRMLGPLCRDVYRALRERGLVAPDERTEAAAAATEGAVEGLWQGRDEIAQGVRCSVRKALRLERDEGLPVFYMGGTPCLLVESYRRWLADHERRQLAARAEATADERPEAVAARGR